MAGCRARTPGAATSRAGSAAGGRTRGSECPPGTTAPLGWLLTQAGTAGRPPSHTPAAPAPAGSNTGQYGQRVCSWIRKWASRWVQVPGEAPRARQQLGLEPSQALRRKRAFLASRHPRSRPNGWRAPGNRTSDRFRCRVAWRQRARLRRGGATRLRAGSADDSGGLGEAGQQVSPLGSWPEHKCGAAGPAPACTLTGRCGRWGH